MFIIIFHRLVETTLYKLEKKTISKVLRTIDLLELFGNRLGMPHSKKIFSNFYELRIRGVQEIRIFYIFRNRKILLLHLFVKKTQKTPFREITLAQERIKQFDNL